MAETWQSKQIISAKGLIDNEGVPRGILMGSNDEQIVGLVDQYGNPYESSNPLDVLAQAEISTGVYAVPRLDASTQSLQVIDYAHHEIHAGSHYFYDDTHSLAKNASIMHLLVTPDTTKWAHLAFAVGSTGGQILVEMFEGPTVSNVGTIEPMFNRNRNFPDTPTTLLYETPTVSADGLRIDRATYGTTEKKSIGGGDRSNSEIVLKQNTMYLFRISEQNVNPAVVNITFDWYEHTDKF